MIQTIAEHPAIAVGFSAVLIATVGYFLRKVDVKVDLTSAAVASIKVDISNQLFSMREDIKKDIIEAFNSTCVERQGSCARLQQAKLDSIMSANVAICAKLSRLDDERREVWSIQRRWNDKVETCIYKDK